MIKASELLKTCHSRQLTWIDNQIAKGGASVFLNPRLARDARTALDDYLVIADSEVEKYVARYLSDIGKKKLLITLRVALNRENKEERLQVNLSAQNGSKLDYLKNKTGLTKEKIINILVERADLSIFELLED